MSVGIGVGMEDRTVMGSSTSTGSSPSINFCNFILLAETGLVVAKQCFSCLLWLVSVLVSLNSGNGWTVTPRRVLHGRFAGTGHFPINPPMRFPLIVISTSTISPFIYSPLKVKHAEKYHVPSFLQELLLSNSS